jgi:hypothetical protein
VWRFIEGEPADRAGKLTAKRRGLGGVGTSVALCNCCDGVLSVFLEWRARATVEHIIHLQFPGDFFSNVQALRAASIEIRFL